MRDVCCLSEIDGPANRDNTQLFVPFSHPHELQQVNTLHISDLFENHYLVGNSPAMSYFQYEVTGPLMAGQRISRCS